ncbi:hypothetical protein P0F65_11835 [Sphingomonas sp. I4]
MYDHRDFRPVTPFVSDNDVATAAALMRTFGESAGARRRRARIAAGAGQLYPFLSLASDRAADRPAGA